MLLKYFRTICSHEPVIDSGRHENKQLVFIERVMENIF